MAGRRQGNRFRAIAAALVVGALAVVGLPGTPALLGGGVPPASAASSFEVQGSVEQVAVAGVDPATLVTLQLDGDEVATGTTDSQGSFLFRNVESEIEPGSEYTVTDGNETSDPVVVLSPTDTPPQALYDGQELGASALTLSIGGSGASVGGGTFGYIETRDGTTLSALVSLPLNTEPEDGPFPVLVEYSGYAPSDPQSTDPSPTRLAANLNGYAWVGVNMRGTTCSGGAFDYYELLQSLDGYDAIETVAAQSWADPDRIGMVGISYPGISQLFVGATQPPHLAAIAPLSTIADTYRSTLYPGGILNSGFATEWAGDRDSAALPATSGWVHQRILGGDEECEDNQALKLQRVEIVPQLLDDAFYEVARGDSLAPRSFVDDIEVPVFLAGAFQDEQTGGQWPTMIPAFTGADPLRVVMTNGSHTEPLSPEVALRLFEFFDLYVKKTTPSVSPSLSGLIPLVYEELYGHDLFGVSGDDAQMTLPFDRWSQEPLASMTYSQALAFYEAEPAITVLWENGGAGSDGGPCSPGADGMPTPCPDEYAFPSFISRHASWPPPSTTAWTQYLSPDGRLAPSTGTGAATGTGLAEDEPRAVASYTYDPDDQPEDTFTGSSTDIWRADASRWYEWPRVPEDTNLSFVTDPMTTERRLLGSASVDLWIRADAPDVDLEVNLTEVRPDGGEVYIQSGWLRASHRLEGLGSTTLQPFQTHLAADAQPLAADEWSSARVEVFPFAHVLRPGSRLRLTVESPGGNRPFWEFAALGAGGGAPTGAQVDVSMSSVHPSRIVLPLVGGVDAPDALPACGALRSQPCRDFEPSRAPTAVTLTATGEDAADATWTAPAGGGAVTGYDVVLAPGGASQSVAAGVTSASFSGLVPGDHTATVTATFSGGDGPVSSPSAIETVPLCAPFADVTRTHPFCRDIKWMADQGIATGFAGNTYRPSAAVTRQAMSAFLYRLAGEPAFDAPVADPTFTDVSPAHPFFFEIEWMAAEGTSTGFGDGTFRPSPAVTRQAMSAFLARIAGVPEPTAPPTATFTDVSPSHPFFAEIEWMAAEGISTGFTPGPTYRPSTAVSRQAMSAFLHRLAEGPGVGA